VGQRIQGHTTQEIGRIVSLPESGRRVCIFMSHHREDQHGEQEYEVAELFQVSVLLAEAAEG
jgi:hypothetical protein